MRPTPWRSPGDLSNLILSARALLSSLPRGCGEIGRRARFRFLCPKDVEVRLLSAALPRQSRPPLSLAVKLNRKQFEGLALEQLDTLYRVARRLTGDPGRAQDLVQETYLRALRGAADFQLEDFGIRPWLLRIMQNLHTSRGQRESRQPRAMDDQHLAAFAREAPTPPPPTGDEQALFDSMDEQLVAALENMPPEYQQVMLLWAVEDFSYREIAAALDVPIGTVMSRLYRARHSLSQQLREYAQRQRLIRE